MRPHEWIDFGDRDELPVSAAISVPTGWLDLNDGQRYRLTDDTLGERSVGFRRREISSPHVEGTWLVSAVAENVVENVGIWVNEFDHYALYKAMQALEDAFTQPYYVMRWQIDQHEWAWSCQLADYQTTTNRDFLHATMGKFTARVPRHPKTVHALSGMLPKVPGGLR